MSISLSKLIFSTLIATGVAVSSIAAPAHAKRGGGGGGPKPAETETAETTDIADDDLTGIACSLSKVSLGGTGYTDCKGAFEGNDTGSGNLLGKLNGGLFDIGDGATWSLLGKSDDGSGKVSAGSGSEGEWSLNEDLLSGVQTFVISLKASTSHSAYLFKDFDFSENALDGLYETIGVSQNNKGKAQGLSHASIFLATVDNDGEEPRRKVPEPAGAIGIGLVTGAMFIKRRRNSNSTTETQK